MTVSLELLARGPSRPDLLEDLVVDGSSISEILGRWSASAPVVVEADKVTGQPALDEVVEVLGGGTPAVVDVSPGLAAIAAIAAIAASVAGKVAGKADDDSGAAAGEGPDTAQSAAHLADLLKVAAHSGVGFGSGLIPRCADASQVWALLSGAVAAMTGGDVRAAIATPDPAAIVGLSRSAREAVRDVITCVLVPRDQTEAIAAELAAADNA